MIVGRPYQTFFKDTIPDQTWSQDTIKLKQGVTITTNQRLPAGGMLTHSCRNYFSDRRNYFGPQQQPDAIAQAEARNSAYDLGCGYSGTFNVRCGQTQAEAYAGTCSLKVDISTCSPPTYTQALDACYSIPTTTARPTGPTGPLVDDWLGVEVLNFTLASLPPFYNITTFTTTAFPCCEVHVGSVCRPDIDFNHHLVGNTTNGRWNPELSYKRQFGYFPKVPCDQQAKSQPRACPRVQIKELNRAFWQWPHCLSVCSTKKAQDELQQLCNRTANEALVEMEEAAHQKKIDLMKAKYTELEQWTADRMPTVVEAKQVIDCFADRLPARYNSMQLPKMRSGFTTMPLHNQCRLHGCKVNQCLQIRKPCKIPYIHDKPEVMCNVYRPEGYFTCVDKVTISSNNPMSLGFGIAWFIIGGIFMCVSIAVYIRMNNPEREGAETSREITPLP